MERKRLFLPGEKIPTDKTSYSMSQLVVHCLLAFEAWRRSTDRDHSLI